MAPPANNIHAPPPGGAPKTTTTVSENSATIPPELFVQEVPHYFLCCICQEVPFEPLEHSQNNCNAILCKTCRDDYAKKYHPGGFGAFGSSSSSPPPCPHCRKDTVNAFIPMNRILRTQYFDPLEVRCPEPCCQKVVTVGSLLKHRENDCEGPMVTCPVENCRFQSARSQMAQHIYAMGLEHLQEVMKVHFSIVQKNDNKIEKK
jgi:hypothetical protein